MKLPSAWGIRDRRSFLKFSVLAGITAASSFIPAEDAGAFLFGRKEHKVSKTKLVMGTYVTLTAVHSSKGQAEEGIGAAFDEINRLNGILSRHISTTPIAQLNRVGSLKGAPPELVDVLRQSLDFHKHTGGAFDITVLPLLQLYESCFSQNAIPTGREIDERLDLIGSENVEINGSSVRMTKSGAGITTDGIAKGYIVDRASEVLIGKGVVNHLINAGGDIKTHGSASRGKPWTIAVQDPAKGREYPEIIQLRDGAVATSGNYEIFFDEARLYHHIVDPKTGRSPLQSKSVTVTAPTVAEADALATSIFVLEPENGKKFADLHEQYHSLIITKKDEVVRSKGWPLLLTEGSR